MQRVSDLSDSLVRREDTGATLIAVMGEEDSGLPTALSTADIGWRGGGGGRGGAEVSSLQFG